MLDQLNAARCLGVVGDHRRAVDDAAVDVPHPRAVHDRQGAQDQHTPHLAKRHQVVGCPQGAERLAGAGLTEHERPAVQGEEAGRLDLVRHRLVPAGPAVSFCDGRGDVLHAQIAQHPCLIQPPVNRDLKATRHRDDLVLGNDSVLVGVTGSE